MKVLIARMNHETNTFSPVRTPLAAFGIDGPDYWDAALVANKGAATAMGAYIDWAKRWGADMVTPISAMANPSGPVDVNAYSSMCERIIAAAPGCDAMLLDLHGAMVVEGGLDGDGELVRRLRELCPNVPIVVSLDLHGNVTDKLIDNATIVTGFKTYPHVDMYESGDLAGSVFNAVLKGEKIYMASRQLPLMTHTLRSTTSLPSAMKRAVNKAVEWERREDVHAVTVMAGFSLSDIPLPCASVIVIANAHETAQALADDLTRDMWVEREDFVYQSEELSSSIIRAKDIAAAQPHKLQPGCENPEGPVLLLDHGDNCMSGGTCDTMDVLEEMLAQGLSDIAVGPICDPEAVKRLYAAGKGANITLPIGNKLSPTGLGIVKEPLSLTGRVKALGDGRYTIAGPTYRGMQCDMGRTVHFTTEAADIIISERTQEHWDLGIFTCMGLDVTHKRYIVLKSRMYCRPVFFPLARGFVECDSGGVTSSNYDLFPFKNLKRPLYPLDSPTRFLPD